MDSRALSAALATVDARVPVSEQDDEKLRGTLRAMVRGYHLVYGQSGWRAAPTGNGTSAVEQEFCLPIFNPEAKKTSRSRTFVYAGKLDKLVVHPDRPGEIFLLDHKSTSEDIESPDGDFWRRLAIDPQVSTYMLAAWQSGVKLDGCLWDVIRKPTIKPKALTKALCAEIVGQGTYLGASLSQETVQAVVGGTLTTENAELFEHRFYSEIVENPGRYFQRKMVPRSDEDLLEFSRELWLTAEAVRNSQTSDCWLKTGSPHGCMTYGRACEYLSLCSGYDRPDSGNWATKDKQHSELALERKPEGLGVLTNSSMNTYKLCQRKYQYRYVHGIEKPVAKDDSRYLGTLLHEALEVYWSNLPPAEPLADQPATPVYDCVSVSNQEGVFA